MYNIVQWPRKLQSSVILKRRVTCLTASGMHGNTMDALPSQQKGLNGSVPSDQIKNGKEGVQNDKQDRAMADAQDNSDSESTTGLEEDEFLVEKVLDYNHENGVDMFLIKWKGWSHSHNTWEPQDNLSCLEKIVDFFKQRERAHQSKRRRIDTKTSRENSVRVFEEEHFQPTEALLEQQFVRFFVDGQLKSKDKMKPIKTVHMEIDAFVRRMGVKATTVKALRKVQQLKDQLMMHRLSRMREEQMVKLKEWERELNELCSEPAKIVVENTVDLAPPPVNFVYRNDYLPGEGITIPSEPVIGCECDHCFTDKACCNAKAGAPAAYTKNGKLRLGVGQPIYECNKICRCGPDCFNRVVQKGRKVRLAIFRTSNNCGWGVKALEPIKRCSFVTEYVGEVITNEEAERRGEKYDSVGVTYLFDLDFNDQMNMYTVDATVHGNISHFINHSCEPNLVVYGMWSDCLDPNLPRLALFACRDIARGEQLSFDYNSPLGRNAVAGLLPSPPTGGAPAWPPVQASSRTPPRREPDGLAALPASPTKSPRRALGLHPTARVTCKCGARTCRRYLF